MPDRPADVGPILRWARRFGILTICRAYGEWRDTGERLAIYNAGVEVVYAPVLPLGGSLLARNGGGAKSLADTAMAVDVTDLLNLVPAVTTLILATSDKDLIPVLRFAQRRGLYAVIVGSDRTAGALKELADEFISYRQLLDSETGGITPPLSRPITVPPVRYPRGARSPGVASVASPAVTSLAPAAAGRAGLGSVARSAVPFTGDGAAVTGTPSLRRRPVTAAAVFSLAEGEPELGPSTAPGTLLTTPAGTDVTGTAGTPTAMPVGVSGRRRRRGGRRRGGRDIGVGRRDVGITNEAASGVGMTDAVLTVGGHFDTVDTVDAPRLEDDDRAEARLSLAVSVEPPAEEAPPAPIPAPAVVPAGPAELGLAPDALPGISSDQPAISRASVSVGDAGMQPAASRDPAPVTSRAATPVVLPGEKLRRLRPSTSIPETAVGQDVRAAHEAAGEVAAGSDIATAAVSLRLPPPSPAPSLAPSPAAEVEAESISRLITQSGFASEGEGTDPNAAIQAELPAVEGAPRGRRRGRARDGRSGTPAAHGPDMAADGGNSEVVAPLDARSAASGPGLSGAGAAAERLPAEGVGSPNAVHAVGTPPAAGEQSPETSPAATVGASEPASGPEDGATVASAPTAAKSNRPRRRGGRSK